MARSVWLSAVAGLALAACGQTGTSTSQEDESDVLPATESLKEFGDYVVYFNALTTDQLNAEIAAEYKISRSKNRVLLNIVMEHRPEVGTPKVVSGKVTATARNLTGQLRNLDVKSITEEDSIYYIAETSIVNSETLVFTIEATPESTSTPLVVRFKKQFYVEE